MQREIGKFAAQRGEFAERLLHAVLAKDALPRPERGAHGINRMGLADRDQRDRIFRPAGGARGGVDAPANGGQIAANDLRKRRLFHVDSIPGTRLPHAGFGGRRPGASWRQRS